MSGEIMKDLPNLRKVLKDCEWRYEVSDEYEREMASK